MMAWHTSRDGSDRSGWPVVVCAMDGQPSEDLSASTTAEERLRMVEILTAEAWRLAAFAIPAYRRDKIPVSIREIRS